MISVQDIFRSTFRDILKNKVRSMLTTLGIIIGVSSVILIASLSSSATEVVKSKIYTYGTNGIRFYGYSKQLASMTDITMLKHLLPEVQYLSPFYDRTLFDSKIRGQDPGKIRIQAVFNDFFLIKEMHLYKGTFFSNSDMISSAKVAIIGWGVKERYYPDRDPINETIVLGGVPFRIVGIMQTNGSSLSGKDYDFYAAVPFNSVGYIFKKKQPVEQIYMRTFEKEQVKKVKARVDNYFRSKFNLFTGSDEKLDYEVATSEDKLATASYITRAMTWLLISVASIALFVGGVGIMNIMLASVNERIREIGVRMAIGAKSRDILVQFLAESVTLSLSGGFAGIVLGMLLYLFTVQILEWPFIFTPFSVFISFFFSIAVGVSFGYYPAKKASRMKPIEALRHG